MLKPGEKAPEFCLPADDERQVALGDLHGAPVVLYFFPKAQTPG